MAPVDWKNACVAPLYKGKDDKYECFSFSKYKSVECSKVCVRILIKRIREGTEGVICEDQCDFRRGRSCVHQVFAVRQMCGKFWTKGKELLWVFIALQITDDMVDRDGLWNVLRLYGLGG